MPKITKKNPLRYETKSGHLLTEKETKFVMKYIMNMGDRIEAVVEAYDIDTTKKGWVKIASQMAYKLLIKVDILEAVRELLEYYNINDEVVDSELGFVILQKAELSPKVKAINEYNKITGRHAEEKRRVVFENLSDEELKEEAARIIEETISD